MIRYTRREGFLSLFVDTKCGFSRDSVEPICVRKRSALAGPNPPEIVDEVHKAQRKCIRTGTFNSRLTLKKHAEM